MIQSLLFVEPNLRTVHVRVSGDAEDMRSLETHMLDAIAAGDLVAGSFQWEPDASRPLRSCSEIAEWIQAIREGEREEEAERMVPSRFSEEGE